MKIVGIIPARYGSTRFEGKPLAKISGKPLLQWVIEGSLKAQGIQKIIVATDHGEIKRLAETCGVEAVMTDSNLPSGSDRAWAVAKELPFEGVINIQGDEPLIDPEVLNQLAGGLRNSDAAMVTLARNFDDAATLSNANVAKVLINHRSEAIYFSRLPIPYTRLPAPSKPSAVLKHVGLYGFKKEFLGRFCQAKPCEMELAEGLEQLRALWLGEKIKVLITQSESWGVDTPEDVIRVEQIIKQRRSN